MPTIPDFPLAVLRWATAMFKQFPTMSVLIVLMAIIMVAMAGYMATHIITGIPVSISRIQLHHFSNYVGFPVDKNHDAQSINYGEVTIANISTKEKVALDMLLHVTGPGQINVKAKADLLGPLGMILGKDDNRSRSSSAATFGEPPTYFRNTVELAPGQIERRQLVFLFDFGSELRDRFAMIMIHDQDYKFDLEISDMISGRTIVMNIPNSAT
jgi:hypothetical protein